MANKMYKKEKRLPLNRLVRQKEKKKKESTEEKESELKIPLKRERKTWQGRRNIFSELVNIKMKGEKSKYT